MKKHQKLSEVLDNHFFRSRVTVWSRKHKRFRASAAALGRTPPINGLKLRFRGNRAARKYSLTDCLTAYGSNALIGTLDNHDLYYWIRKPGKVYSFEFIKNIARDHGYQLEE